MLPNISLLTPKDVCERANNIDYGLHHQEPPRITFWAKITKTVKAFYLRVKL